MTKKISDLHEAGGRIKPREDLGGDKYKIRLMGWDEGSKVVHGSSADYPVSVIKRDFGEAFPPGTRMRANHDGFCEDGGDITRIVAKTIDTPWAEKDGMYATAYVSENYTTLMREFADVIGTSISAAGELDERNDPEHESYDPDFPKTVARFYSAEEAPYNSVDFVEAPGADGRIVMAVEAARKVMVEGFNLREQAKFVGTLVEGEKSPKAVPPTAQEGKKMDEETKALIRESAHAAAVAAVEALRPAPEEVRMESVAEAAIEAGLSKEGRESVYERVAGGMSTADAIAKEKARESAIEAEVTKRVSAAKEAERPAPAYVAFGEAATADYSLDELAGV